MRSKAKITYTLSSSDIDSCFVLFFPSDCFLTGNHSFKTGPEGLPPTSAKTDPRDIHHIGDGPYGTKQVEYLSYLYHDKLPGSCYFGHSWAKFIVGDRFVSESELYPSNKICLPLPEWTAPTSPLEPSTQDPGDPGGSTGGRHDYVPGQQPECWVDGVWGPCY